MPAPARPKKPPKPPTGQSKSPGGVPSSEHSDIDAIVQSVILTIPKTTEPESDDEGTQESASQQDAGEDAVGETQSTPPAAETVTTVARQGEVPTWAPLDHFAHNPDNPRWKREYDPTDDPELKAFGLTFDSHGLLQAVTVTSREAWLEHHPGREDELDASARWVVYHGNRRLATARHKELAGLPFYCNNRLAVPSVGREAIIIENYQRKGLDPVREAGEMKLILDDTGQSQRAVAKRLGVSHVHIGQRLQLLDLIHEFQGMVSDLQITVQKALPIANLHPDEQRKLLELGPPYHPARLQPASVEPVVEAGKTLSSLTIRRNSTPSQVAETLRSKLTPEVLAEVLDLLQQPNDDERGDRQEST